MRVYHIESDRGQFSATEMDGPSVEPEPIIPTHECKWCGVWFTPENRGQEFCPFKGCAAAYHSWDDESQGGAI